ncbi:MAG: bifunctional DNA-formamidopyrimidine glycosylase/DNA-(apurinic or apyrimidinic site) lyase [Anaerolineales bacterium]|nr:bifunctional DNA-formamidopyrimidine glycosylase/DNA-(apurinic or apyrimidinic site) lyase [Anaerolineales bacterium]
MPELPEVETFARTLRPALIGKTILSAELRWKRTLASPSPVKFRRQVAGQQIGEIGRRAKFLDLQLDDFHLVIHLRMSGDLLVVLGGYQPARHDHLLLHLSDDATLVFSDPRKFGRVWLTANPAALFQDLGPEPLSEAFHADWLYTALQTHRRQLKPLLLDQTFVAGLGNIYADEALHLAGLHPLRISSTITEQEAGRLHYAIRRALLDGISHNGASIDWAYRGGDFQNHFHVYGRAGEACHACGTAIERIVVGQRSTHFCPLCQKSG